MFQSINDIPMKLDPARLDDGRGIEETLRTNKAKYHQSCQGLFSSTRLDRARKRSCNSYSTEKSSSSKVKRCSIDHKQNVCFLCEQDSSQSDLRQAMTMKLNTRLNECAQNLNDGRLLAILSAGDVVAQELKYHAGCLAALYNKEKAHLKKMQLKQIKKTTCTLLFSLNL